MLTVLEWDGMGASVLWQRCLAFSCDRPSCFFTVLVEGQAHACLVPGCRSKMADSVTSLHTHRRDRQTVREVGKGGKELGGKGCVCVSLGVLCSVPLVWYGSVLHRVFWGCASWCWLFPHFLRSGLVCLSVSRSIISNPTPWTLHCFRFLTPSSLTPGPQLVLQPKKRERVRHRDVEANQKKI